jgi:dihydrolipoamide dehydrogenase
MRTVDVAIIGAGTAGLNAMAQARKAGKSFVLINGGAYGTTCARVGCMPSKAFIQIADDFHRRRLYRRFGIEGGADLSIDSNAALEYVRELRDTFVERVTSNSTDKLGAERVDGYATFLEPTLLRVGEERIRASNIVIATGSSPVVPEPWKQFGDCIVTTDGFFEHEMLPASVAVIGLGVIGLELGQALQHLDVATTGIDRLKTIGGLSDPGVNRMAIELIGKNLPLWLGEEPELKIESGRIRVSTDQGSVIVEKVLVCMGRRPNLSGLGLEGLGVVLDERGIPKFDPSTMQIDGFPIFLAGDVSGHRPVLHEASEEGRIAGFNAARETPTPFRRKTAFTITFSDPNIVQVGMPWSQLEGRTDIAVGEMRFAAQGRALIMGANRGLLRIYAEKESGRLLGAAMVAPRGENLAHLIAWSLELGLGARDLAKMPYYHPVIEEGLQGAITDLLGQLEPGTYRFPAELTPMSEE